MLLNSFKNGMTRWIIETNNGFVIISNEYKQWIKWDTNVRYNREYSQYKLSFGTKNSNNLLVVNMNSL